MSSFTDLSLKNFERLHALFCLSLTSSDFLYLPKRGKKAWFPNVKKKPCQQIIKAKCFKLKRPQNKKI